MSSQERALLQAANDARLNKMVIIVAVILAAVVGLLIIGAMYYSTYVGERIVAQKIEAYKLCLENQKLSMTAAVERRGYLSIPDCGVVR